MCFKLFTNERQGSFNRPVMIRVKPETYEKLKEIANCRGDNVSMVIREAIKAEIEFAPELAE